MIRNIRTNLDADTLAALRGFGVDYTGDMANAAGRGAIVSVQSDQWGQYADIVLEDGRRIARFPIGAMGTPEMRNGCAVRVILTGPVHGAPYLAQLEAAAILRDANMKAAELVGRQNFERAEAARIIKAPPVFYWNGIKDAKGAKLQRAWYSDSQLKSFPAGTITIYARDYERFSPAVRECFSVENHTDTMTDYFDSDTIRVIPSHPLYAQVKAAMDACTAKREERAEKRRRG